MDTTELLNERGKTHGDYGHHANITQNIKTVMANCWAPWNGADRVHCWHKLRNDQKESLDMIAHKIGRILAGDPDFRDHWDDIAGYAKLAADRCSK